MNGAPSVASRRRVRPGSIAPRRLIESGKPCRPLSSFPSNRLGFSSPNLRRAPRHRSSRAHAPCLYKDFIENASVARLQAQKSLKDDRNPLPRVIGERFGEGGTYIDRERSFPRFEGSLNIFGARYIGRYYIYRGAFSLLFVAVNKRPSRGGVVCTGARCS